MRPADFSPDRGVLGVCTSASCSEIRQVEELQDLVAGAAGVQRPREHRLVGRGSDNGLTWRVRLLAVLLSQELPQ